MRSSKTLYRDFIICSVLACLTLAIYWPLTRGEFVNFDDNMYLLENARIQKGLSSENLFWAFTTGYAGNWHPLTWISHMIDCQLYGMNPGMHHLTNIILHVANTVLLYALLRTLTGAMWRSALVAALFAWHPIHVESVAWIAERKDVLSAFFGLLAILAYVLFVRRRKQSWFVWVHAAFALSLMAKPMLVTLPIVFLLLDIWPLNRISLEMNPEGARSLWAQWRGLLFEKQFLVALSAVSCVITYYVQSTGGGLGLEHLSLATRIGNAVVSYVGYVGKIVWPSGLAVLYPYDEALPGWQVILSAILILALTAVAILSFKRERALFVGWMWFLVTLVPVIGLIQVGNQSMADRYTYIPAIGLFIAVAWTVARIKVRGKWGMGAMGFGCAIILISLASAARSQVRVWENSLTLFKHALGVTKNNSLMAFYLGQTLASQGRINEAMTYYGEAIRMNPTNPRALSNYGLCLAFEGRHREAIDYYARALDLKMPADQAEGTHFNYGLALVAIGQLDAALGQFQDALRINRQDADVQYAAGSLLVSQKRFGEARAYLVDAASLRPNDAAVHTLLGVVCTQLGDASEAAAQFEATLRLDPNSIQALNNLAWIRATNRRAELRDGGESVRLAEHACGLTRNVQPMLLGTLAAAYAEAGRFEEAQETARKAIELASKAGQVELESRNRQLLEYYLARRPYREQAVAANGDK